MDALLKGIIGVLDEQDVRSEVFRCVYIPALGESLTIQIGLHEYSYLATCGMIRCHPCDRHVEVITKEDIVVKAGLTRDIDVNIQHIDMLNGGYTVGGKPANMILDLRVQQDGARTAESLIEYGKAQNVTVKIKEFQ